MEYRIILLYQTLIYQTLFLGISLKLISNFASHTMETFKRKRVGFRIMLLYQTLIYQNLFLEI